MKVGDLVSMRAPSEDLPVGLVIETKYNTCGEIWCTIFWDDGTQFGAWNEELKKVS